MMEEGQNLPPIKVVCCASYGGLRFSQDFKIFLDSRSIGNYYTRRGDPALIQVISDYGRFICDKFPFILDDMRTVCTWKLDKVLAKLRKEFLTAEMEFNPDLVTEQRRKASGNLF